MIKALLKNIKDQGPVAWAALAVAVIVSLTG